MVIVGGATRLTDSGLSITEWKPVTGAIPPLNEQQWQDEFEKYKTIPEYEQVNFGMTQTEFKTIYWWEWGHRFLGRLIGFAFIIPLIFFIVTKRVSRDLIFPLSGLFILGGLQGALGWYMVQSGLSDRIDVSQYRLAAHLGLAVILYGAMYWLALNLISVPRRIQIKGRILIGSLIMAAGVFLQLILGAFVAGLRAGKTFNTWPLMDGKFFPDGYFNGSPKFLDLFETMAAVQFNHRMGAYMLVAGGIWLCIVATDTILKRRSRVILATILAQVFLGVLTVVNATPIALGLAHQAGALALLSVVLFFAHGCIRSIEITASSSSRAGI